MTFNRESVLNAIHSVRKGLSAAVEQVDKADDVAVAAQGVVGDLLTRAVEIVDDFEAKFLAAEQAGVKKEKTFDEKKVVVADYYESVGLEGLGKRMRDGFYTEDVVKRTFDMMVEAGHVTA